jgi:hypothetical protein
MHAMSVPRGLQHWTIIVFIYQGTTWTEILNTSVLLSVYTNIVNKNDLEYT